MITNLIRRLGILTESIHAVVYFAPELLAAYEAIGLRGYWRGYFASRASALGRPSAELVTALFAGFSPSMVARAVPDIWDLVPPDEVQRVRVSGATAALDRLLGRDLGTQIDDAVSLTTQCVETLALPGRPMAAAHRALARPDDQLGALWHNCTVLREHRGDGHLIAVAAAGLIWPEPHLLKGNDVDPQQQAYRGWDDATWEAARRRVHDLDGHDLEDATDRLASAAYAGLSQDDLEHLSATLEPLAARTSLDVPYPNAMGLPRL